MVRIEGTAEMLDDLKLKKKVVEKFTFLKPWVESQGYEVMVCYRLDNAKATTWTMETNFEPKKYIEL
jgi:pyridoxamine 5'-phosphate oxidase